MSRVSTKQIWQAQLERAESALPNDTFTTEAQSCLQATYDLRDISAWVNRTVDTSSIQFRVTHNFAMDELKPTALGEQLLRLLPTVLHMLRQQPRDLILHPNICLLINAMQCRHVCVWELLQQEGRQREPRTMADLLNGVIEHVRHESRSAAFRALMKRHERSNDESFERIKAYFRALAAAHQNGRVIRLELIPNVSMLNWRTNDTYGRSHACITKWIQHLESSFGVALSGWAFKVDRCIPYNRTNLLLHVMLLIDDMTEQEFDHFVNVAQGYWSEITEGQGQIHALNSDLRERQFRSPHDHGTILDQLHATAVYMAATDDLIRLKTDGGPPAIVMGVLTTKKRRLPVPAWPKSQVC